ncbi:hypothetical protein AGMMS49525_00240 [Bacteroidia bacterium]|nr:hypothetical protein AGMMS49525_00240 [Bacteroidia bacterium]
MRIFVTGYNFFIYTIMKIFNTLAMLSIACVAVSCESAKETKIAASNAGADEAAFQAQVTYDNQAASDIVKRLENLRANQQQLHQSVINTDQILAARVAEIQQQSSPQVVKKKSESQTFPYRFASNSDTNVSTPASQSAYEKGFIGMEALKALNAEAESRIKK